MTMADRLHAEVNGWRRQDESWQHVADALDRMRDQSDRFDTAVDGLMIAPESPLREPMGRLEQLVIEGLGRLVGDDFDSIAWYVYDCDYGRKPKEAGCPDDMRLIDSVQRLRWLVELRC